MAPRPMHSCRSGSSNVELGIHGPDNFRRRSSRRSANWSAAPESIESSQVVRDNDQSEDDRGADIAFPRWRRTRRGVLDAPEDADPTPMAATTRKLVVSRPARAVADTEGRRTTIDWLEGWIAARRSRPGARARQASDGWIGDGRTGVEVRTTTLVCDGAMGVVTAIDITHDPPMAADAGKLAEKAARRHDKADQVHHLEQACRQSRAPIGGRSLGVATVIIGKNPHNKHVCIFRSVRKGVLRTSRPVSVSPCRIDSGRNPFLRGAAWTLDFWKPDGKEAKMRARVPVTRAPRFTGQVRRQRAGRNSIMFSFHPAEMSSEEGMVYRATRWSIR